MAGYTGVEIAIVGMAGRLPGTQTLEDFWQKLRDGTELITVLTDDEIEPDPLDPEAVRDPRYVKARAILAGYDLFDAAFFGFTPREAELLDPQQRNFLECAWEALENAGYDADRYPGPIGLYAGASTNTYLWNNLYPNRELLRRVGRLQVVIANERDHVATQTAYKLNLRGPVINVQTGCSTSLVAIAMACQSLLIFQCDMALAGGVSVTVPHKTGYLHQEGGILSPDGHCRAFDAGARGAVPGSGAGVVVLKRLEDALADGDSIHAVIRGSAVNNDGALKVGYTAPSVDGQAAVIATAQGVAGVEPDSISYIETHGTGTELGDPIEVAALTQAFRARTNRRGYCALGSLKTNMGHLDAAAGVAGLIKATLALKHREIPPSLHFTAPNPQIDFEGSPFYVNTTLRPWESQGPRRAGVSSFGIGGTNAHVILEEAPDRPPSGPSRSLQVLPLSARTETALAQAARNLADHLQAHPEIPLADVAYTLQVGRKAFAHRQAVVCGSHAGAAAALKGGGGASIVRGVKGDKETAVAFLFPGQGAQYARMTEELYQAEPAFRRELDRCAELLRPHLGLDLRAELFREDGRLNETWLAQPALFAVSYALARVLMGWGIRPQVMLGHSVGEYAAACLAGVMTLEEALGLVAARGRLVQGLHGGAMLAVPLAEAEVQQLLSPGLWLAAVNGPVQTVMSGTTEAVEKLAGALRGRGVECRRLHTSHAFHSELMEPAQEAFAREVAKVRLRPPNIPYVSNVTGNWITAQQATDVQYWVRHLREPVRFGDGLSAVLGEAERVLVEVGPGRTLSALALGHPERQGQVIVATVRHPREEEPDQSVLLGAVGQLWAAGVPIDWAAFAAGEKRQRVLLPAYPFERKRYWVEARPAVSGTVSAVPAGAEPEAVRAPVRKALAEEPAPAEDVTLHDEVEEQVAQVWRDLLGVERISREDNFFELGGHSLLATQIMSRLRDEFQMDLSLRALFASPTVAGLAASITEALMKEIAGES